MKTLLKLILLISVGVFSFGAKADVYVVNGGNYTTINTGTMFSTSMNPTAWFATSSTIPANLVNADIGAAGLNLVNNFSASDGVHTYAPSNATVANSGVFTVSTDGSGNLISFDFRFRTPKGTPIAPTTYDIVRFRQSSIVVNDKTCTGGTCDLEANTNVSVNNTATYSGTVTIGNTTPTTSIPTLSEWGMIMLSGLLALSTFVVMRRRQV